MKPKNYVALATVAEKAENKRKEYLTKYIENYIDDGSIIVGEISVELEYQGHFINIYPWTDITDIKTGCVGIPKTKQEAGDMWENSTLAVKYATQALMAYKYMLGGV